MDSDQKFWLSFLMVIAFVIVSIFAMVFTYNYKKETKMAQLGYELTPVMGSSYHQYQKIRH